MKKILLSILTCALIASLCGCSAVKEAANEAAGQAIGEAISAISYQLEESSEKDGNEVQTQTSQQAAENVTNNAESATSSELSREEERAHALDISTVAIPEYSGNPTAVINNNVPLFEDSELVWDYYMELSELDSLGRCGSNVMCADEPHIQTGQRGRISDIHPSGWHSGGFYERSHLLMWKLSGCNEPENLISGTDTFNQETMLEYEERVTAYLWRNPDNHVMYRVTPLFRGSELVARGVLMEAWSVEDGGRGLSYCVFCYNVEPDYEIDYATGDYRKL